MNGPAARRVGRWTGSVILVLVACQSVVPAEERAERLALEAVRGAAPPHRTARALRSVRQSGACQPIHVAEGAVAASRGCAATPAPTGAALEGTRLATQALSRRFSEQGAHAVALNSLLWGGRTRRELDRAISLLSTATTDDSSGDPAAFVDLGAAYLDRAEVTQSMQDVIAALDVAARAPATSGRGDESTDDDSVNRPYLRFASAFNEVLALDYLTMSNLAVRKISSIRERYAGFLRSSQTEGELVSMAARMRDPVSGSRVSNAASRELGWKTLLPGWANAELAGDDRSASRMLDSAAVLARTTLERGGDGSLGSAVAAIRAERSRAARRGLARGHLTFARADSAWRSSPDSVLRWVGPLLDRSAASPALLRALSLAHALARLSARDIAGATDELERLRDEPPSRENLFIRSRAASTLGVLALRQGRYDEGVRLLDTVQSWLDGAGENEMLGYVRSVLAEAQFEVGRRYEGYTLAQKALRTLGPNEPSIWRHNTYLTLVRAADIDGYRHAALEIAEEMIAESRSLPVAQRVEARIARATTLFSLTRWHEGLLEMRAARSMAGELDSTSRSFLIGDLVIAAARASTDTVDRELNETTIDSVVADPIRRSSPFRSILAYRARAAWRLRQRDTVRTIADLDTVMLHLEGLQRQTVTLADRAGLIGLAEETSTALARLSLSRGEDRRALQAILRLRAPLAILDAESGAAGRRSSDQRARSLVLALIDDTLYSWSTDRNAIAVIRSPLPRSEFGALLSRANVGLAQNASATSVRPALSQLYELVLRPLDSQLPERGEAEVRLIPLGMVAEVPFAALYDARRGRYLVERTAVVYGSSVITQRRDSLTRRRSVQRALIVGDPQFSRLEYPSLEPVAFAAAEADVVASSYPNAIRMEGAAATREAIVTAIEDASIFHFAGHALLDGTRAERSQLVTAGGAADALTASEIAKLDLRRLQLAVLSACTGTSTNRASGVALSDLAGAFLAAGAAGVIASPWLVDDATSRQLMERLHAAYGRVPDGARALRVAQMAMIRGMDGQERSPGSWAAFRYLGR